MTASTSLRVVVRKPYVTSNGDPLVDIGFGADDDDRVNVGTPTIARVVSRKPYDSEQVKHAT